MSQLGHLHYGLRRRAVQMPDAPPGVLFSDELVCHGLYIHADDFFFCGEMLGCVLACILEDGILCVLVEEMDVVGQVTQQSVRAFQSTRRAVWLAAGRIMHVLVLGVPTEKICYY